MVRAETQHSISPLSCKTKMFFASVKNGSLLQMKSITTFVSRNTFIWLVPPTLVQVLCQCQTLQAVALTPWIEGFRMVQSRRRSVGIPALPRTLPPAVHLSSQQAYRQAIGGHWQKETILECSSKDCSLPDCYTLQYSFFHISFQFAKIHFFPDITRKRYPCQPEGGRDSLFRCGCGCAVGTFPYRHIGMSISALRWPCGSSSGRIEALFCSRSSSLLQDRSCSGCA